jgi:hypothetical protein
MYQDALSIRCVCDKSILAVLSTMLASVTFAWVKRGFPRGVRCKNRILTAMVHLFLYSIKAGQCRTNPWPAVPDWPWCRNADAGFTQLTAGQNADAGLSCFTVFRHFLMQPRSPSFHYCLSTQLELFHRRQAEVTVEPGPAIQTASLSRTIWATLHPTELRCILLIYYVLSYAATYWAALYPSDLLCSELRCTLLSYAVSFWSIMLWATLHPTELRCILLIYYALSYDAPYWAALYPLI